MDIKLSAQEIESFQRKAKLASIPNSGLGVAKRAKKESWGISVVKGRGGKGGVKTLYALPDYVIREIEERGLSHLLPTREIVEVIQKDDFVSDSNGKKPQKNMSYETWAASLDTSTIVPIAYDPNIFGRMVCEQLRLTETTDFIPFKQEFLKSLGVQAKNLLCVPVLGNSMFPTLTPQGIALFDISKKYEGEHIYLIRQVEELKIKRLQMITQTQIRIISDNKDIYTAVDIDLTKVDSSDFEIIGKYLWHGGRAK